MKKNKPKDRTREQIQFLKEQHSHINDNCFDYIRDYSIYKEEIEGSKLVKLIQKLGNNYAINYEELINFKAISFFDIEENYSLN